MPDDDAPAGPRTGLVVSAVGILAGLVSLLAGLANAVRHGSEATTTAMLVGGLGILGSVALSLGRPPADRWERRVYLGVVGAFYLAVLVALVWIAFA